MKKSLVLLLTATFLLGLTGLASANFIEEYTGYQYVGEGDTYNFGFDLWYANDYEPVTTDSSLALTTDAEGAFSDWTAASIYIDFYSTDLDWEKASINLTAFNGSGNQTFSLGSVSGFLSNGTWSYSYDFTQTQLSTFEAEGWGSIGITADFTPWYYFNNNDFAITKVGMDVSTVPEPATLVLLGSGLAGLAFYRRKRK